MTSTRTPWWAAAVLTLPLCLLTGCGTEETPTPSGGPSAPVEPVGEPKPAPEPTPVKEAAPAPKAEPTPKAEPAPAEASKEAPKVEAPKIEAPKAEPAKEAPKGASAVKLSDEELAEIKKLPAGDRDLALKQAVCPVSGEHLGTPDMGAPVKVTAEGTTFFICCKGCESEVKENAKAVIAKLPK
ncbi:MAG: hypothetical protein U0835_08095 [Isosphaeraceae bacterium]